MGELLASNTGQRLRTSSKDNFRWHRSGGGQPPIRSHHRAYEEGTMATRPLDGKAALITGASRGIGKGIALSFAEAGADLLLAARSMDDLERTASEAASFGVRAETISMDAYDLDQVYAAVD